MGASNPSILFLTSRLPYPPDRGDRLRVYNILKSAASRFTVDLLSLYGSERDLEGLEALRPVCRNVEVFRQGKTNSLLGAAKGLSAGRPLQVGFYENREAAARLRGMLEENDYGLIYTHLLRMAPYALLANGRALKTLDLTDCISNEYRMSLPYRRGLSRTLYKVEGGRMARMEGEIPRMFDDNWVISPHDRDSLRALCGDAPLTVVPNGVDLEGLGGAKNGREETDAILFVGHMSVPHNVDAAAHFAEDILPLVRKRRPEARFYIVGQAPDARTLGLVRRCEGVEVAGYAESLRPWFERAAVFVAPLRFCAGVQNKALESMATRTPVVATPAVNRGLDAREGEEILVAEDPAGFAAAVCGLLENPARRRAVGEAGRRFVEGRFSWSFAADRFSQLLEMRDALAQPEPAFV